MVSAKKWSEGVGTDHAILQHRRPHPPGPALPHPTARPREPRRPARSRPRRAVLRAPRPAADRQDVGAAGAARPAERWQRLPLRLRDRGGRAGGAGEPRGRHARHSLRAGVGRAGDAGQQHAGGRLAGCAGAGRAAGGATGVAGPLVHGRPAAAGAADRRDRHAGRRYAAVRAAAVARRLPGPPRTLPAQRDPVRRAGRARLPHLFHGSERPGPWRQRVQHQVEVVAAG